MAFLIEKHYFKLFNILYSYVLKLELNLISIKTFSNNVNKFFFISLNQFFWAKVPFINFHIILHPNRMVLLRNKRHLTKQLMHYYNIQEFLFKLIYNYYIILPAYYLINHISFSFFFMFISPSQFFPHNALYIPPYAWAYLSYWSFISARDNCLLD